MTDRDRTTREWVHAFEIEQPRAGYRYNMDSMLMGAFAPIRRDQEVLDIGTGSGVIPLFLLSRNAHIRVTAVEIQPELAQLARRNFLRNGLTAHRVLSEDVRALDASHNNRYHLVVSNPPYFRDGEGRPSQHAGALCARHEITLSLPELLRCAVRFLRPRGRFCCIYPIHRLGQLMAELPVANLTPLRLRMIHSKADRPARAFLFEGGKDGGSLLRVDPPLVLHEADGSYSAELLRVMKGGALHD